MHLSTLRIRGKAVWGPRRVLATCFLLMIWLAPNTAFAKPHHVHFERKRSGVPGKFAKDYKLDRELSDRSERKRSTAIVRVIAEFDPGTKLPKELAQYLVGQHIDVLNAEVLDVPEYKLKEVAAKAKRLHFDRPTAMHNYRTSVTVGAKVAQDLLGYTGAGV